jgi:hypothetical protein
MTKPAFLSLCTSVDGVSQPDVLLEYLHRSGVVFHHDERFNDQIVLDQQRR